MAADMNVVTLVGRLTRDPEIRHTAGGDPIANIRLAVTSRGKRGDQWEDTPNYFDVVVFGRQAGTVESYLSKGRRIGVTGRLSWREWEGQGGAKRQSVEVVAQDVFFLDSRQDGENPAPAPAKSAPADADDLPF